MAGKYKERERDLSALSAAARAKAIEVMGQLGKLGDETFPARILEYVGLRSKMYSILTVQPDGARKEKREKRQIKGVPKKAVTNVRHLEYREVLEEGSERRAAFAQLRSRAHELREVGVAPGDLLLDVPEIHQLLELPRGGRLLVRWCSS